MESSATDCKEMSRGEHANRHDVRFVANLARNLGGCDQDIFGKISRSRTSLKGSSVIVTVTRTIRFVTGERRLHCQMPYPWESVPLLKVRVLFVIKCRSAIPLLRVRVRPYGFLCRLGTKKFLPLAFYFIFLGI